MLTLPYRFEVLDAFTPPDARQYCALFILPVLRDHDCDRLAYDLFGSVAEYPLGTPVPAGDNAVEIFAYNCIITRLNNGRQKHQLLLSFTKIGFDLLALRNVAIDFNHRAVTEHLLPAFYNDFTAILQI